MAAKTSRRAAGGSSSKVVLSSVMRCDDPGQLTVPNHLNLGNDGKLYLTRSGEAAGPKLKPQPISLRDSVAWFRVGKECGWILAHGDCFGEWLKMIEKALS
jgi:hypothetical protein